MVGGGRGVGGGVSGWVLTADSKLSPYRVAHLEPNMSVQTNSGSTREARCGNIAHAGLSQGTQSAYRDMKLPPTRPSSCPAHGNSIDRLLLQALAGKTTCRASCRQENRPDLYGASIAIFKVRVMALSSTHRRRFRFKVEPAQVGCLTRHTTGSSSNHLAIFWQSSSNHPATIQQSSGHHLAIV